MRLRNSLFMCSRHLTHCTLGRDPKLILELNDETNIGPYISAVLTTLPLLSPLQFPSVEIDLGWLDWSLENATLKSWEVVDNAISLHCPLLTHFKLKFSYDIPYHNVLTPHYGCDDNVMDALFPRMAQKGIIERVCVDGNCRIHTSIRE